MTQVSQAEYDLQQALEYPVTMLKAQYDAINNLYNNTTIPYGSPESMATLVLALAVNQQTIAIKNHS